MWSFIGCLLVVVCGCFSDLFQKLPGPNSKILQEVNATISKTEEKLKLFFRKIEPKRTKKTNPTTLLMFTPFSNKSQTIRNMRRTSLFTATARRSPRREEGGSFVAGSPAARQRLFVSLREEDDLEVFSLFFLKIRKKQCLNEVV